MTIALFVAIVVATLSLITAAFLLVEFRKKFGFMQSFLAHSSSQVRYQHRGDIFAGPGMRKIALRSQTGRPFAALVGFTLKIPIIGFEGFDYYGMVQSDRNGVAVISTFIGRGDVEFVFVVNRDNSDGDITASLASLELAGQFLIPQVTYPPHWWQRLGFFS